MWWLLQIKLVFLFQRDDRDRVLKVGDWSEHVSSSGKKYYYNCKTEVSQWEKPREWIERERDRERFRGRDRERDDRYRNSSSRPSMRKSPQLCRDIFLVYPNYYFLSRHDMKANQMSQTIQSTELL